MKCIAYSRVLYVVSRFLLTFCLLELFHTTIMIDVAKIYLEQQWKRVNDFPQFSINMCTGSLLAPDMNSQETQCAELVIADINDTPSVYEVLSV